jgi:hypothetical protein
MGVDQTKNRINPAPRPKVALRRCARCPYHGTAGQKGLIGAQSSDKMHGKAFYLGNVGLDATKGSE